MVQDMLIMTYGMLFAVNSIGIALSYGLLVWPPRGRKIQDRSYEVRTLNGRMPLMLLNLGLMYSFTYVGITIAAPFLSMDAIPWWSVLLQCLIISLIDDTVFYFYHRWLHLNKAAYRRIHKIHHKAFTPVPVEYIYVHPLEWMMGALAPVAGMLVVGIPQGALSFWVFLVYSALRNLHELDIHSGLKSKWLRFVPGMGLTEHHDLHHSKPNCGNYGSSYVFWDRIFGTLVER